MSTQAMVAVEVVDALALVSVVSFFRGGRDGSEPRASMRMFNALPPGLDAFAGARW